MVGGVVGSESEGGGEGQGGGEVGGVGNETPARAQAVWTRTQKCILLNLFYGEPRQPCNIRPASQWTTDVFSNGTVIVINTSQFLFQTKNMTD